MQFKHKEPMDFIHHRASHMEKYDVLARALHWLVALGILSLLGIGIAFGYVSEVQTESLLWWHKSIAMTVLALMVIRLIWRCTFMKTPPYPDNISHSVQMAAHLVHGLLYVLIFTMLLSGWLLSSWAGYPVPFWGLANMALPVAKNLELAALAKSVHYYAAWSIGTLIALHIAAAWWHQLYKKDHLIRRMM